MSSSFVLPTQPNYGQINPYAVSGYSGYGGFSPYSSTGTYTSSQNFGTALGNAGQMVNPNASMEDIYAANRNQISQTGNVIGQEAGNQLNYYDPLQQQYTAAENQALNNLQQTPGFTPQEAGQINVNYSQFNTPGSQYTAMAGNPYAPVQTLAAGQAGQGEMLNQYQSDVGSQLQQYGSNLGGAVQQFGTNVGGAVSGTQAGVTGATGGLQSGLTAAQDKFQPLNTAVYNPALGFDPNQTEQQMTPQEQQAMVTAAGTTVGNTFQSQRDAIARAAAQQGNTSPEALAAMEQQLTTQQAATAGDTMTNAQIAAEQAAFQRAQGIEAQREGAVQTQTGLEATAATTEEAAAQAAAGLGGQQNISAQEYLGSQGLGAQEAIGQQGISAANELGQTNLGAVTNYGQFSTNTAGQMAGAAYGAQSTAEQEGAQRAQTIGAMQYGQGTGSAQLTAQGAQSVGAARMAGQNTYLGAVAGQQAQAQQGGQAAMQAQLGAYGTQTSGITQNASSQGQFETNKASLGDTAGKSFVNAAAGLFAEGGVATEPTLAKLGERGPEMVVPLTPRYRSTRQFGKAA